MMSTDIKKQTLLENVLLSNEHYFQSLLQIGYQYELLTQEDVEHIQLSCMQLLKTKIEEYTLGESSSVRTEVAGYIMESNFYTISLYLKTLNDPEIAIQVLKEEGCEAAYQKGYTYLKRRIASTKSFYSLMKTSIIQTENQTYLDTIIGGITGFFKLYTPDFGAHDTHITADYPTAIPMTDIAGIEFIQQYIEKIQIEDTFCQYFSPKTIHYLLCDYGLDNKYQELIFNIFEQVFMTALFCELLGKEVRQLEILDSDKKKLQSHFEGMTKVEILEQLEATCDRLFKTMDISDERYQQYMKMVLERMAGTIYAALELGTFPQICLTLKIPQEIKKIYYDLGEKMPAASYRAMVEELNQCRFSSDKLQIIANQVQTLSDLVDVLLDVDFEEEELRQILQTLEIMDLAALADEISSYPDFEELEFDELEQVLYRKVKKYINTLPPEQQVQIKKIREMYGSDDK